MNKFNKMQNSLHIQSFILKTTAMTSRTILSTYCSKKHMEIKTKKIDSDRFKLD